MCLFVRSSHYCLVCCFVLVFLFLESDAAVSHASTSLGLLSMLNRM